MKPILGETNMQITLIQAEIETAIKQYVEDLINIKDNMEIAIDLKAGRGVDGFTAAIDIVKKGSAAAKTVIPEPQPRRGILRAVVEPEEKEEETEAVSAEEEAKETATEPEQKENLEAVEAKEESNVPRKSIFANLN